jgi:hypothetical protein
MIVVSETESPKKIWYIARRFRIPRELIGPLLSTMKRTYIDWSDRPNSRVKTGLEDSGRSLYLARVSLHHTISKPIAELNIGFGIPSPEKQGALITPFIDGRGPLMAGLDKKCLGLGLHFEFQHRIGYSNFLIYGFDFSRKPEPFSVAAIKVLVRLFEDVLLIDAGYLYWLRMTQETVRITGENTFVPYCEDLLKRSGVRPCSLL